MVNEQYERCGGRIVEIDHASKGLPQCNRWQASAGAWCRLAPDDIIALRALNDTKTKTRDSDPESCGGATR